MGAYGEGLSGCVGQARSTVALSAAPIGLVKAWRASYGVRSSIIRERGGADEDRRVIHIFEM